MNPPCKECLKYAICIGKKQLSCDDFYTFFNDTHDTLKSKDLRRPLTLELRNEVWDKVWVEVRTHMPNCQGLFRDTELQKMPNFPKPTRVWIEKDAK